MDTLLGVRQVIPSLQYNELVMADIIPFGVFDSITAPKRKFPTIVYQTPEGRSKFGHFVEAYMRACIEQCNDPYLDLTKDERLHLYPGLATDPQYEQLWKTIQDYAIRDFTEFGPTTCTFDAEIRGKYIAGHPDLVVRTTTNGKHISDVKTTTHFEAMREETVLQLLSYAALYRYNNVNVDTISVALPWQRMTIVHDISDWNHENFLFMLESAAQTITSLLQIRDHESSPQIRYHESSPSTPQIHHHESSPSTPLHSVGSHIRRAETLYETFTGYYCNTSAITPPCQIFLAGNQGAGKKQFSDEDIAKTQHFIEQNELRTFIHAPYSINLSRPFNQRSIDEGETHSWAIELLRYQIDTGVSYGARGVVVHVGKPGTSDPKKNPPLTVSEAKSNMTNSIRQCLDICNPQCQLLIETPAGQGTELYTDKSELWEFWMGFTAAERSRMGICIDTCHVFAAGDDPIEYLQFWLDRDSTAIALIHLNDSKHERGSRKDRHAAPGFGHIGNAVLTTIVRMANEYGIPMVME